MTRFQIKYKTHQILFRVIKLKINLNMKTLFLRILIFISLTPFYLSAQQATSRDSLLEHMTGKWVLQGTIEGKQTTHDVVIEWVLDHQYLQINEVSREKKGNGKPEYEAIVYISHNSVLNSYNCLWLDNTGNDGLNGQAIGHAEANGTKLEFLFKGSDASIFHTTFAYDKSTDSWQWIMNAEMNGKLQPFASVKLTR